MNKYLNEILSNTDNNKVRSIKSIDSDDKKNILPLNEIEALILWNHYFSENVKYALLFERTYGAPIETPIFDESKIDSIELKETLRGIHRDETPILIYWNSHIAVKTTWGLFVKYWDNFFYYPEDAIIYVDQDQVYFYNEMMLKKINKLKNIPGESIFECLQKLKDNKIKKINQIDCLFNGIPCDLQDKLYYLFYIISEGFKVIETDEIRKEYMEYCITTIWANTEKILLAYKPYNQKSSKSMNNFLDDPIYDKVHKEKFHELLKKIIAEKS